MPASHYNQSVRLKPKDNSHSRHSQQRKGSHLHSSGGDKNEGRNDEPKRCYNCGSTFHLAKNCKWKNRGGSEARSGNYQRRENKTAQIAAKDQTLEAKQEKLYQIRRELKEAEVDLSVTQTIGTMRSVTQTIGTMRSITSTEGSQD